MSHQSAPRRPQTSATDRHAVLAALRPGPAAEQGWSEQAREAARQRVLASDPARTAAAAGARDLHGATRRPSTARRRGVTAAAAGVLLVAGGGAAAATGHLPLAFTQAFAGWAGDWSDNGVSGVDPDTAERVATTAGPDGTVFTVMAATTTTADGAAAACTVVVLETADSARRAGPSDFQDVSGSGCQPSNAGQPFGAMGVDVARAADSTLGVTQDLYVWFAGAGEAASAQVVTADGRSWPAVAHDGTLYGWFPALREGEARPALVGYAADGTEVARTPL